MRSSAFILLSLLPVGDSYRTSVDEADVLEADADDEWAFRCPHGLEANVTARTCIYRGEMFEDPDAGMTEAWAGGSDHPLIFKSWGGLENAEAELIAELQFMLTQPAFVSHFVGQAMAHHHATSGVTADLEGFVETLEEHSENLAAVEFIAHHAVQHLVIESLAVGLTTLAEAAMHGGIGLAAHALEGTAVGLEVLGTFLANPVILGYTAVHTALQLREHFRSKDERSRSFAVGLVSKADCIASKITLHREELVDNHHQLFDSNFFVPEFAQVCGEASELQLVEQMVKTNAAMIDLFQEFKGIGKCIFPEGSRAWSKSNCVHAIYDNLHSHEGENGILYSAFALAAAYGQETDGIVSTPMYSKWFERYFKISIPHARDVREDLIRVRDTEKASIQERATTCISVMGLHCAFERVFIRLRTALKLYMHTFARHKLHLSTRTTLYPCRRVFRKFEDRAEGLCKDGADMPLIMPDSDWLGEHAQYVSQTTLTNVGTCIEDTHPELAFSLSLSSSGPEEGENEDEEHARSGER